MAILNFYGFPCTGANLLSAVKIHGNWVPVRKCPYGNQVSCGNATSGNREYLVPDRKEENVFLRNIIMLLQTQDAHSSHSIVHESVLSV